MHIAKYDRFWAVYDKDILVCVAVYKKGALEVIRRLTEKEEAVRDKLLLIHDLQIAGGCV